MHLNLSAVLLSTTFFVFTNIFSRKLSIGDAFGRTLNCSIENSDSSLAQGNFFMDSQRKIRCVSVKLRNKCP